MLDPLTALGVAGNVLQIIDFGIRLVSEGNEIHRSANGTLEENRAAEELAKDLESLTRDLSKSQENWIKAHGATQLDPEEIRLRNICDKCTEIAVDLNIHLQKLKVPEGAKHRKLKSYKQALVSVWRQDKVEDIARRLAKYQDAINTHVLLGLRKSAHEADVKNSTQFSALDQQTKELTLAVLEGGKKLNSTLSDQTDVLVKIHDQTSQILNTIGTDRKRSPSPLPAYEAVVEARGFVTTPLHEAAQAGDSLKARQLLRSWGVDVNARDEYGCTPLHVSSSGDVAKTLLRDRRIDKNLDDNEGHTALHCAVLKRRLDVIKSLLEADIDKDLEDDLERKAYARGCPTAMWLLKYGHEVEARADDHLHNTGLLQLAWFGDVEGTKFFLRQGAEIDVRNDWKETALSEAARHGSAAIVELLIKHGAKIELAAADEWTPLLQAIRDNRDEVVQTLLRHGANKEAKLKNGNTPLGEACKRTHFRIAEILVEAGSKIETPNDEGRTPLSAAAFKGRPSLTRLLLRLGANKEVKDTEGRSPLFLTAEGGHPKTLKVLLESGTNVNTSSNAGYTALSRASQKGHADCVELLLEHGADMNVHATKRSGYTALAEASHHGRNDVAALLLRKGARWDIGSNSGHGAVSIAAANGQNQVLQMLVEQGADLEQRGFANKDPNLSVTPLMRAAIGGHSSTIGVLAELGARLDERDALGRTALYHAASNKHTSCVSILIQKGASLDVQTTEKRETALMIAAFNGSKDITRALVEAKADQRLTDWRGMTPWIFAVHHANDEKLEQLLSPAQEEDKTLRQMQAERHPSEIAEYLNKIHR